MPVVPRLWLSRRLYTRRFYRTLALWIQGVSGRLLVWCHDSAICTPLWDRYGGYSLVSLLHFCWTSLTFSSNLYNIFTGHLGHTCPIISNPWWSSVAAPNIRSNICHSYVLRRQTGGWTFSFQYSISELGLQFLSLVWSTNKRFVICSWIQYQIRSKLRSNQRSVSTFQMPFLPADAQLKSVFLSMFGMI